MLRLIAVRSTCLHSAGWYKALHAASLWGLCFSLPVGGGRSPGCEQRGARLQHQHGRDSAPPCHGARRAAPPPPPSLYGRPALRPSPASPVRGSTAPALRQRGHMGRQRPSASLCACAEPRQPPPADTARRERASAAALCLAAAVVSQGRERRCWSLF